MRPRYPAPACSWHPLPWFPTYVCCQCDFSDHLKKRRPCSDALSWSSRGSLEFETSADSRAATGLQEGGGGKWGHGDQQHIPSLEPQCGVPVHILKHYNCLLFTGFVLSSSPFPPTSPHTPCSSHLLFSQLFYLYVYQSFLWLLHHLTGVFFFLVNAAASRWVRLSWLSSNTVLPPRFAELASRLHHAAGRRVRASVRRPLLNFLHQAVSLIDVSFSHPLSERGNIESNMVLFRISQRLSTGKSFWVWVGMRLATLVPACL